MRKLYMFRIHSTVEKRAKRMPDFTIETTRHMKKVVDIIVIGEINRRCKGAMQVGGATKGQLFVLKIHHLNF